MSEAERASETINNFVALGKEMVKLLLGEDWIPFLIHLFRDTNASFVIWN